jgi:hypothetical protein
MPLASARSTILGGGKVDEITALERAVANQNWGSAHFDGFLVGVIDTIAGTIIAPDQWQTGERYALIVCPRDYEKATNLEWGSDTLNVNTLTKTRWNGLGATKTLLANQTVSNFPAFEYCQQINNNTATGLRGSPADTSPSRPDLIEEGIASEWYVPAFDELGLMYWRLKPTTTDNTVGAPTPRTFPNPNTDYGVNPSSDPIFTAHTTTVPAQTSILAFQDGEPEHLSSGAYWSSTDTGEALRSWRQSFLNGATIGSLKSTNSPVRLVRRVQLSS